MPVILEIILGAWALAATAYCGRLYLELWRWARQCQHARIAISYKGKVQLQAPILEWILWCNQLDLDKQSNGRVVWRNGHAAVAIAKKVLPQNRLQLAWGQWKNRKAARPEEAAPVRDLPVTAKDLTDSAELRRQRRLANEAGKNQVKVPDGAE